MLTGSSYRYKGHLLYENSDTSDSLAFKMYSDGIRSIIFSEGVEERELKEFLEIVSMSTSGSFDDDIVTTSLGQGVVPLLIYS